VKGVNLQRALAHRLVGLFGKRNRTFLHATTSKCPQDEDTLGPYGVTYRQHADGEYFDFFREIQTSTRHTLYLLYRLVIDLESTRLARIMFEIRRQVPRFQLFQVNTDSLLYFGQIPELGDDVRSKITKVHRLHGTYKLPLRNNPVPVLAGPWREFTRAQAREHVLAGGSLCVEALAGCGKSTFLRELAAELRAAKKKVQMIAVTHVATANLEDDFAMTCSRFTFHYGRGKKNRPDVLCVDEVSMIDPYIYTHLNTIINHARCQCLFAGDWSQLPPVLSQYMGSPVHSMRDMPWLKERCGFNRLVLTECVRSDQRLHVFYSAVAREIHVDIQDIVQLAHRQFPRIADDAPINLVHSHVRRIAIIRDLQEKIRPAHAIWVEPVKSNAAHNHPQPLWLWEGMDLICSTRSHNLRNQWTYKLVYLSDTEAHMKSPTSDKIHKFTPTRVVELFRSTLARTYHAAQGLTFDCRVRLWDTRIPKFSREHLIVGMSRCTRSELLDFGS
jgi:hypothetical protein